MGIGKPLGKQKKQNVETNGGEKPLGNPKKNRKNKMWRPMGVKNHWEIKKNKKNKMWRPMGVKSHWGIQKKIEKTKCGDQWG